MSDLDRRALRDAFGSFPTGVTVVTTIDDDGARCGFTANSFASVSLEPPLLLVCPSKRLSTFRAFDAAKRFAVSVLAEGQEDVSNVFAGYKGDRFAAVDWRPDAFGAPIIEGAAAHFSCETVQSLPAGDHAVLIGQVVDFGRSGARGLGYAAGEYFSLGLERAAAGAAGDARKTIVGAVIERDGAVLLSASPEGFRLPTVVLGDGAQARSALAAALAAAGVSVRVGKAYSVFDDRRAGAQTIYFRATAEREATGGLGVWTAISELSEARYASSALRAMMKRYAFESETRDFSLYVGDDVAGDVQSYD